MTQAKLSKSHRWDPDLFARVEDFARRTARPVQHVLDAAVEAGLRRLDAEHSAMVGITWKFAILTYQEQMVSNQEAFADKESHKAAGEWLKARELESPTVKAWPDVKVILAHRRADDPECVTPAVSHDWGSNRDDFFTLTGNRILVVNAYGEVYGWQLQPKDEVPEIAGYEEHEA